ncbi:MAG: hypothetical protein KGI00_05470 [Candidatus Micrarchaeota archaeon]|nr:hypothetical protein [Candidatus Micrarchaeota archaeon]MDE1824198.1 hypothetical protein [Candidatus Micrarchaeota archaeon]MDE1850144.1 hypothetical protein [Candidatus Micrarchaeota archaeon]
MEGYAEYKVPDGKLVSVKVTYSDRIESLQILGDFFIHPEESLTDIENIFINMDVNETEGRITEMIRGIVIAKKIEMIGVTPEAIAKTTKMAIK